MIIFSFFREMRDGSENMNEGCKRSCVMVRFHRESCFGREKIRAQSKEKVKQLKRCSFRFSDFIYRGIINLGTSLETPGLPPGKLSVKNSIHRSSFLGFPYSNRMPHSFRAANVYGWPTHPERLSGFRVRFD